jgi:hypothetical protein
MLHHSPTRASWGLRAALAPVRSSGCPVAFPVSRGPRTDGSRPSPTARPSPDRAGASPAPAGGSPLRSSAGAAPRPSLRPLRDPAREVSALSRAHARGSTALAGVALARVAGTHARGSTARERPPTAAHGPRGTRPNGRTRLSLANSQDGSRAARGCVLGHFLRIRWKSTGVMLFSASLERVRLRAIASSREPLRARIRATSPGASARVRHGV